MIRVFSIHKAIILVLAVTLLLFISMVSSDIYADTTMTNKKIISVVYDDSGSMSADNKIAYANYAMQTLTALSDSNDELYITYMSDWEKGAKKIDLDAVDDAVKGIRNKKFIGSETPIESVETAYKALESAGDNDPETQYWLIILSDGIFAGGNNKYDPTDMQGTLERLCKETMPNGSNPHISYMGIGQDAVNITPDQSIGLESYSAKTGKEIMTVLADVSDRIAGRIRLSTDEIEVVDDHTLKVSSKIPLTMISVLSQGKKSKVESVTIMNEKDLYVDRNISLKYPKYSTDKSLTGSVATITGNGHYIPAGDYLVQFSNPVDKDRLVVMYLPAIQVRVDLIKDGKIIDDPSKLVKDNKIDIELHPVNPENGEEIPADNLPTGIQWGIEYQHKDKVIKETDQQVLRDQKVFAGRNKVVGSLEFPNMAPIIGVVEFDARKKPVYGIQVEQPDDLIYQRHHLGIKGSTDHVRFVITNNGDPVSPEEAKEVGLEIVDVTVTKSNDKGLLGFLNKFSKKKAAQDLRMDKDGSFILYPQKAPLHSFVICPGTYTVKVSLVTDTKKTAVGQYQITASISDWRDLFLLLLILAMILYLLYLLFLKRKFSGERIFIDQYRSNGDGTGTKIEAYCDEKVLHRFGTDFFSPRASRKTVGGITVYADSRDGGVIIKGEDIVSSSYQKYGKASGDPEKGFDRIVDRLTPLSGDERIEKKTKELKKNSIALGRSKYYLYRNNSLYAIRIEED